MPENLSKLFNTPMSRKKFLYILGASILSMIGFSAIVGILKQHTTQRVSSGYGSGPYGGYGRPTKIDISFR